MDHSEILKDLLENDPLMVISGGSDSMGLSNSPGIGHLQNFPTDFKSTQNWTSQN